MPETVIPFQPKDENGNLLSMKTRTNTIYKPNGDPLGDDFLGTADIADNLTTQDPTKVLSAKQGAALNSTLANVSETLIDNTAKIYYKVKNGIVRLRFAGGTVDLTSGSWVTYGSLPNGVRKPDETEYASVTCGSNGKYAGIVMLSMAGTISYYCNYAWGGDASIKSIWGELVY